MQPGSCRAQTLHFGDSGGRRSPAWLWGPGCWVEPAGQELCQDAGFSPAESCPGHPRPSARVCPGEPVALWRHIPSPQGVPEDRGRRWALRDPWGLRGHLPLGGQVGRSPPTGGKAKVRGTPRSHPPPRLGARGRIPGRGSGPQGSPSAGSSDEACPGPAETRTLLGGGRSTTFPSPHSSFRPPLPTPAPLGWNNFGDSRCSEQLPPQTEWSHCSGAGGGSLSPEAPGGIGMDHEGPGRGSWSTGDPQGLSDTQGPKCHPIQCPQGTGGEAWVQTRRRPGVPAKGSTGQWPGLSVPPWSPLPSPPLTSGFQEQLQDGCVAAPSGNVHRRTKRLMAPSPLSRQGPRVEHCP